MKTRLTRLFALVLALIAVATTACSTPSPINVTASPEEVRTSPAAPGESSPSNESAYDPNQIMFDLFPGFGLAGGPDTQAALDKVLERRDTSQIAVMVEMIRFLPSMSSRESTASALRELTGQPFGGEDWTEWTEWYGANAASFPPPDRYLDWKINLMGQADPRFAQFLRGTENTARIDYTELLWGGVIPDGIPDLLNPRRITPGEAVFLEPHERVFGVEINGESMAYPLRIINAHEMVNDVVGDEPVALSWCTLCSSGILYRRTIDGEVTTFGTSGFLYRSNKVMYDRRTNTLWSQHTAEPVIGPLADSGLKLEFLPISLTTWGEWLAEHPNTQVLSLETGYYSPSQYEPENDEDSIYFDYRASPDTLFPVWERDGRLDTRDEVLGVVIGDGIKKAYAIEDIQSERVINDVIGDGNIVVIGSAASSNARAYYREAHSFAIPDNATESLPSTLIDSNGVEWKVTDTQLVNAEDATRTLGLIPANVSFWFGWFAFNNDTEVYGASE